MEGQDQEGPPTRALSDDSQEPGVDGAEVVVLDAACDRHAIVAALLGGSFTKDVSELGAAVLRTPCHLGGEGSQVEDGQGQTIHLSQVTCTWLYRGGHKQSTSTIF